MRIWIGRSLHKELPHYAPEEDARRTHTSTQHTRALALPLLWAFVSSAHPPPTGIKLKDVIGTTVETGCGVAGTLGLYQGIVSVCSSAADGSKWVKITGVTEQTVTVGNPDLTKGLPSPV